MNGILEMSHIIAAIEFSVNHTFIPQLAETLKIDGYRGGWFYTKVNCYQSFESMYDTTICICLQKDKSIGHCETYDELQDSSIPLFTIEQFLDLSQHEFEQLSENKYDKLLSQLQNTTDNQTRAEILMKMLAVVNHPTSD